MTVIYQGHTTTEGNADLDALVVTIGGLAPRVAPDLTTPTIHGAAIFDVADAQGGYLWLGCTGPLVGTENHGARIAHTSGGTGAGRGMQITNVYTGTYASTGIDVQGYTTGTTAQDHLAVVQSFGYVQSAASPGLVYAYYGGGENQGSGTVANAYGFYHAGFTNTGSGSISNKWAFYASVDMSSFAGLKVTGGTSAIGSLVQDATLGLCLRATTGSAFDVGLFGPAGTTIYQVPTGTVNVVFGGSVKIGGGAAGDSTINKDAALGLCIRGIAGSTNDLGIFGPGGTTIMVVPTGTVNPTFSGVVSAAGVAITTSTSAAGRLSKDATLGLVIRGVAGSANDIAFFNAAGSTVATVGTGGVDMIFAGGLTSKSATAGVGYSTGAGGTVTQATSKATGVTLNKAAGQITLNAAALAADTTVSFVLTNSAIAATDLLLLMHNAGGTPGSYTLNARCAAGSATIDVHNVSTGSLSEAIVLTYVLIKGVTA